MKRMTRMFLSIVLLAGLLWPCTTVYKNPTAVIDVNKTEVTPGTRLYFDGSNSHDNDENGNSIAYYEWFIDGIRKSYGSGREEFDYPFNTIRDYTVKLTVRDDEGKSASQTITISVKAASQRYYHLADHLGNVRATVTGSGKMVSKDAYYPFGMRIAGLSQTVDDPDPRYKYNGKELDEEKGLNWLAYGARYYDSEIGRWHVVDPAGQYWNSYSYGGNNSLNGLDPDGRFFIIDDFLFGFMSGIFTGASLESSANWGLSLAKNSTKLWGSFFQGDAHQIVSKFTWELPQQLSGVFWGHTNNMFSNVLDVRQYDDVTHVKMGTEMALTLGNIIITSFGVSTDPYAFGGLFRHETGHYVQSQYLGPLYLPLVGFPSIITATFTRNHHMYPWETTAQRLGKLKYPAGGRVE